MSECYDCGREAHVIAWQTGGTWVPLCCDCVLSWWSGMGGGWQERQRAGAPERWIEALPMPITIAEMLGRCEEMTQDPGQEPPKKRTVLGSQTSMCSWIDLSHLRIGEELEEAHARSTRAH